MKLRGFDTTKDVRATKNDPRVCRGRWARCGGKYRNVNAITWHICNACSIARIEDMAKGFIAPNVRAVAVEKANARKTRKATNASVASPNARVAAIDG